MLELFRAVLVIMRDKKVINENEYNRIIDTLLKEQPIMMAEGLLASIVQGCLDKSEG